MQQELELVQGEDARFDIPVLVDGVAPASGIAGWAFTFLLLASQFDQDNAALLTYTSGGGAITFFNSAAAIARVKFPAADVNARSLGKYHWRLLATDPAGTPYVLNRGTAIVTR